MMMACVEHMKPFVTFRIHLCRHWCQDVEHIVFLTVFIVYKLLLDFCPVSLYSSLDTVSYIYIYMSSLVTYPLIRRTRVFLFRLFDGSRYFL